MNGEQSQNRVESLGASLVRTATGWRVVGLGDWFQAQCRTPEWRAALIVWQKYKRKLALDHQQLVELRQYVVGFSTQRRAAGKPASKEFLIQKASEYCQGTWTNDGADNENGESWG